MEPKAPGSRAWHVRRPESAGDRPVLVEEMPGLADVIDAVVARLVGAGLIFTGEGEGLSFGPSPYYLTSFSEFCVAELRRGDGVAR